MDRPNVHRQGMERLRREAPLKSKPCSPHGWRFIDLGHHQDEIADVAIDKVPAIGLKLVMNLVDESRGAVKIERLVAPDQDPEQVIEPDEMVDMGVRNENMFEAMDLARRQGGNVAEVEQNGAGFKQRLDIECRIAG